MKYLVTGGAGYIGSHVVQRLVDDGHTVDIIDNLSTGSEQTIACLRVNGWTGNFLKASIGDTQQVPKFIFDNQKLDGKKYDGVFHFASFISAPLSCKFPLQYYENNVSQFIQFLSTLRFLNINKIVLSSSASVYGNAMLPILDEDAPINPICPYGDTKAMMERILKDCSKVYHNFKFVALRYFNVAGSNLDRKIGDFNFDQKGNVIPMFLTALAGHRGGIELYGTDYNTNDGTCVRDYIHIDDLVDAHILAIEHTNNQIYNVGNGVGYSVKDILHSCLKVTGRTTRITEVERRSGDPPRLVSDVSKIQRKLGWSAKVKDIDVITRSAWEWYRKIKNLP